MAKRCPLCGGKLNNENYCGDCGYAVPDDEELSALYDMDPGNDAFGSAVREIIPERQAEEIYPNRPQPVKLKVRDSDGETVSRRYKTVKNENNNAAGQGNHAANGQTAYNNNGQSPYNNNGSPSPYVNARGGAQFNTPNGGGQTAFNDLIIDFLKNYWWSLLLLVLMPTWICFFTFFILLRNNVIEQKYKKLLIAAFVLALLFPPW